VALDVSKQTKQKKTGQETSKTNKQQGQTHHERPSVFSLDSLQRLSRMIHCWRAMTTDMGILFFEHILTEREEGLLTFSVQLDSMDCMLRHTVWHVMAGDHWS